MRYQIGHFKIADLAGAKNRRGNKNNAEQNPPTLYRHKRRHGQKSQECEKIDHSYVPCFQKNDLETPKKEPNPLMVYPEDS